jgi:cytochrome c oxidase accessory protein FixG
MSNKTPNLISLGSINEDGSKRQLHPADTKGRFLFYRRLVALVLIAVYVALPWIPINGYPAVFLDVAMRRFHFFGLTLATQDLWVFFFLITGLGFSLFYLTALFGRVWCGWTCPYTVFLEHVFRRVERLIDGDATARRRLDAAPWTKEKIIKRVLKNVIYLLLATAIAHIFLSYFVSLSGLYGMMHQSPLANVQVFGVVALLTVALYFCFSWFREQFCVIMCPYGRIQSALTDDHTVIIGYDEKRGEPRGKTSDPNAGDCISCNRCVQVCPTGIDIRNGLQLECIGCSACVDACDDIMKKVGRKPGLIRYDSLVGLSGGKTKFVRGRTMLYTFMMLAGVMAFLYAASRIEPFRVNALRMVGQPFYVADGAIRNQFTVRVINKRNEPRTFRLALAGDGMPSLKATGLDINLELGPLGEEIKPVILSLPEKDYNKRLALRIAVTDVTSGLTVETKAIEFVGPNVTSTNHDYLDPKQYLQK